MCIQRCPPRGVGPYGKAWASHGSNGPGNVCQNKCVALASGLHPGCHLLGKWVGTNAVVA